MLIKTEHELVHVADVVLGFFHSLLRPPFIDKLRQAGVVRVSKQNSYVTPFAGFLKQNTGKILALLPSSQ